MGAYEALPPHHIHSMGAHEAVAPYHIVSMGAYEAIALTISQLQCESHVDSRSWDMVECGSLIGFHSMGMHPHTMEAYEALAPH